MTKPHLHSGPPPRDAEALDSWLESITAMRSTGAGINGHDPHATLPAPEGTLVTTARAFHHAIETAERTSGPATPRHAVWERIMHESAIVSDAVTSRPRRTTGEASPGIRTAGRLITAGSHPLVTAALAAGLVIAIIATFAWLGRDANLPPTPTEGPDRNPALAASPPATAGTAGPIDVAACDVEPISVDLRQQIIAEEQDRNAAGPLPSTFYVPAVPAAVGASTASNLADLERSWQSCNQLEAGIRRQTLESPRLIAADAEVINIPTSLYEVTEEDVARFDAVRALGDTMLSDDWRDYYIPYPEEWTNADGEAEQPIDIVGSWLLTDQLVPLQDGRVVGPIASWTHPMLMQSLEDSPYLFVNAHVYVRDGRTGSWLVDEEISLCIMGCDQYRAELVDQVGDSEGLATPTAAVVGEEWTADPAMLPCELDASDPPGTTTMTVDPALVGTGLLPFSTLNADEQASAATVYQTYRVCSNADDPAANILWAGGQGPIDESFTAEELALGQQISSALPAQNLMSWIIEGKPLPADASTGGYAGQSRRVLLPDDVVQLADGRIGGPAHVVQQTNHPDGITAIVNDRYVESLFVIFTVENGRWVIADSLPICIGDCDAYWAQFPLTTDPASAATPEGETGWLADPVSVPCTVTSVESYPVDWTEDAWTQGPQAYMPFGVATADDRQMAAEIRLAFDACTSGVDAVTETPLTARNSPILSPPDPVVEAKRMRAGQEISTAFTGVDPLDFVIEGDPLPPDPSSSEASGLSRYVLLPEDVVQLADGRLGGAMRVYARSSDPAGAVAQMSLNNHVQTLFVVLTVEDGRWVIADYLPICIGECDDFWADSAERTGAPDATPLVTTPPAAAVASAYDPSRCPLIADLTAEEYVALVGSPLPDPATVLSVGPIDDPAAEESLNASSWSRAWTM